MLATINQSSMREVLFVRRRFAKLAVASVVASAVVGSGLVLATSVQAETATPLNVVALGDSYGSGTGAGDYQVVRGIDATLRETARQARVAFVSPYVNSVDLDPSFAGHSLCESTDPFYRGFDALAPGQEGSDAILHLSRTGQTALADLIAATAGDVSPEAIPSNGEPARQA